MLPQEFEIIYALRLLLVAFGTPERLLATNKIKILGGKLLLGGGIWGYATLLSPRSCAYFTGAWYIFSCNLTVYIHG